MPAIAGLLQFPRVKDRLSSRLRTLLDVAVIALGVLFISWATVLGPLYLEPADDWVVNVVGLGYPTVDVVVAALVLALGMRQPAERRRLWALAGGAFLVLTATDSGYVYLLSQGQTGSPAAPWSPAGCLHGSSWPSPRGLLGRTPILASIKEARWPLILCPTCPCSGRSS